MTGSKENESAILTLVTRVKVFDVVRVDIRNQNGQYHFLIGAPVEVDINSEILTSTSTFLVRTVRV